MKKKLFISLIFCFLSCGCHSAYEVVDSKEVKNTLVDDVKEVSPSSSPVFNAVKASVDKIMVNGTASESAEIKFPSIVIGVVTPKTKELYFFGVANSSGQPNKNTIYPISSISKMVTGLILARGIAAGDFTLPQKVKNYLPSQLAPLVGERTFGMLVSHYAAYRAKPMNLNFSNRFSPAAGYSIEQLAKCLAEKNCSETDYPIGTQYLYSDLGIGLLGIALVNHHKVSGYESLFRSRIADEMELKNSSSELSFYKNLSLISDGFTLENEKVSPATMGALVAAGGILSNGEDMLKLLEGVVNPTAKWQSTLNIASTLIKPKVAFAIDLVNIDGTELYSKSGEQAGYSSIIMWSRSNRSGVFILGNRGMASKSLAKVAIELNKFIIQNSL